MNTIGLMWLFWGNIVMLLLNLITLYGIQQERIRFHRTLISMIELKKRKR